MQVWNLIWCMLCSISPLMLIKSLIFECQLQNRLEAISVLKLALLKLQSKFKLSKQSSPKHQKNCPKKLSEKIIHEIGQKNVQNVVQSMYEIYMSKYFCFYCQKLSKKRKNFEALLSPQVDSQLNKVWFVRAITYNEPPKKTAFSQASLFNFGHSSYVMTLEGRDNFKKGCPGVHWGPWKYILLKLCKQKL